MPCFHPVTGYYSSEVGASGKRALVFKRELSFSGVPVRIPCGRCIGCRLERSRQWAIRLCHEKYFHKHNWFVTLTYDDKHLQGPSLVKRHVQLFMKRLRKEYGNGIRFFACGEYGGINRRPHYHIILFNCDFSDKRFYKQAGGGQSLFTSARLATVWEFGYNVIAEVNFRTCAYVARYVVDKVTGDKADDHYVGPYGEVLEPEFCLMSRRPGIGTLYFDKYGKHVYELGTVCINGKDVPPPRFYDEKFKLLDSDRFALIQADRRAAALLRRADNTPERRRVKEHVVVRRMNDLAKRGV